MIADPQLLAAPSRRRPWSPKPRDEAIYRAVRIAGRSQTDVAAELHIAQSTVSRVVKKFDTWRGSIDPAVADNRTARQQQRLDRWLAHERHEEIYAQAMRFARRMHQPALTTRTGERGDKKFSEETRRDQHLSAASFLRTAQRSADALTRLAEHSPTEQEQLDEPTICQALLQLREAAEADGSVPRSDNPYITVMRWLSALLGRQQFSHPPEILAPGSAVGEIVRSAMSACWAGSPEEMLRRLADSPPNENEAADNSGADSDTLDNLGPNEDDSHAPDNYLPAQSSDPRLPIPDPLHSSVSLNPEPRTPNPTSPRIETHNCIASHVPSTDDDLDRPAHPNPCRTSINEPLPPGALLAEPTPENYEAYAIADKWSYANDPLGQLYRRIERRLRNQQSTQPRHPTPDSRPLTPDS